MRQCSCAHLQYRLQVRVLAGVIPDGLKTESAWLRRIAPTTDGYPTISEPREVSDEVFGGDRVVVPLLTVPVAIFREGLLIGGPRRLRPCLHSISALFVKFAGLNIFFCWLVKGCLLA